MALVSAKEASAGRSFPSARADESEAEAAMPAPWVVEPKLG
jgi:hypothetical protein